MSNVEDLTVSERCLEVLGPLRVLSILLGEHSLYAGDAFACADARRLAFLVTELGPEVPTRRSLCPLRVSLQDSHTSVVVVSDQLKNPVCGSG